MSEKNSNRRKAIMRRVRKQRLRYISILPSFITLLNGIAGFASICIASRGATFEQVNFKVLDLEFTNLGLAGLMIFLAMIADVLDGRVARMSHSTSSFGGQLDSLCDAISFGIAPAFLAFKYLSYEFTEFISLPPNLAQAFSRFIWVACAVYISCAVIRLARFNVENEEDESAHMSFAGLPTPAAAGAVTCLIVFIQDLYILPGPESELYRWARLAIFYMLPVVLVCIGSLMISRVRYPHVINQYLRGKKPIAHLIFAVVLIMLIVWSLAYTMVIVFFGFAIFGYLRWLFIGRALHAGKIPAAAKGKPESKA